jgi:outer membrane protein OmpA-like peptidoglycan-associated protein
MAQEGRKEMRLFICTGSLILATFLPGPAFSQNLEQPEIESEFSLSTFHTATTPEDGLQLEHADVLGHLQFAFQGTIQIDDDPLTWQRKNADGTYTKTAVNAQRLILLHLDATLGFLKYGQIGLHFPVYLDRGTANSTGGRGDLVIIPKGAYRFPGTKASFGLSLLIPMTLPTGISKHQMGEGTVTIGPKLVADVFVGRFRIALNTGIIGRKKENNEVTRGSEMHLGLGAECDIINTPGRHLRAIIETNLTTQLADFFNRNSTPLNLLGGIKYRFISGIGIISAIGAGLTPGIGTPDIRFILGVNYLFRPKTSHTIKPRDFPDADGDGIPDKDDLCPTDGEDKDRFDDQDGCPDLDNDNDTIPDSIDLCPNVAETVNNAKDTDGCPDSDADGDGVIDREDDCPSIPEDVDGFEDHNGCPDTDNDFDTLLDDDDECPLLPESANGYQDEDGCPDYFRLKGNKLELKRRMRFIPKSEEFHDSAFDILDEIIAALFANPTWKEIQIHVHTSGQGDENAVQILSEERAMTIMRVLVASGIVPERLVAIGKGNSEPLASPKTAAGRRKNARVVFQISTEEAQ